MRGSAWTAWIVEHMMVNCLKRSLGLSSCAAVQSNLSQIAGWYVKKFVANDNDNSGDSNGDGYSNDHSKNRVRRPELQRSNKQETEHPVTQRTVFARTRTISQSDLYRWLSFSFFFFFLFPSCQYFCCYSILCLRLFVFTFTAETIVLFARTHAGAHAHLHAPTYWQTRDPTRSRAPVRDCQARWSATRFEILFLTL